MKNFLTFFVAFVGMSIVAFGQSRSDKNPVTYEELYDEPYAINKLFVQFQPLYGEIWTNNINAGFGLEVSYFLADKMNFRAHARKSYATLSDITKDIAEKNMSPGLMNEPESYNYYEIGGTYHIKDFEESSKTKMFLYKKSYAGDKWASRVPLNAEVPCKVRKIYGGRLGGLFYDSSVDINRLLEAQDKDLSIYTDQGMPATVMNAEGEPEEIRLFSHVDVGGLYVGGSMSWIKNIAVDFDNKYQEGVDDLIFTAFLDVLITPYVYMQDIFYTDGSGTVQRYNHDGIDFSMLGFRAGMDGKFNRTLSWGYGGEIGFRPGLKNRGFYALVKISFPVFSTNLDYEVEAFGK